MDTQITNNLQPELEPGINPIEKGPITPEKKSRNPFISFIYILLKIIKWIFLSIIFLLLLSLLYLLIIKRLFFKLVYPKPEYLQRGGLWGTEITRCLCYGQIKESFDPTSDPSTYSYCTGWLDHHSCEMQQGKTWSRESFLRFYGKEQSLWDWIQYFLGTS